MSSKTINILGVTGSIGQAAADVVFSCPERFDVRTISAYTNKEKLAEMAHRLNAEKAVLSSEESLEEALKEKVDITLAAIVGVAGLKPVMAAIENSRAVAIANKEPLVAAGKLVMAAAKKHGTKLLPVDSEHNAIFQVFDFERPQDIERIVLTASGGPFREWPLEKMRGAAPEEALAHPNWDMGKKISIDSATMMNKALEMIEAHYLFGLPPEKIDVMIHPQSVVHSMVEYNDGSVLAQMGASDMRTPLSNVLSWPARIKTPGERLDLEKMSALTFEKPDTERFPALDLARMCMDKGVYACAALNAANETAVEYFLTGRIGFLDIVECVHHVLEGVQPKDLNTIEDICSYDREIKEKAAAYLKTETPSEVAKAS